MRYIGLLLLVNCLATLTPVQAQQDFREESIYFLMTTRFFDGDSSNNAPTEWSSYNPDPNINPNITDPKDVTWRGDFKGLIEKLDYIKDLGFTAIWITPIVQNWSPLDYHGYHAYDFTKVDPRLESEGATFQDLINEIHDRDMKIVLDVVTNHAGRFGVKGHAEIKYNTDPNQPWGQDKDGNPLQPNPDWEYDGLTPNPDDGKIWSRANIPTMPAPFNENLAAHNWPSKESYVDTSDPEWYHHDGNGFAQGYDDTTNLYNRALAGDTPDFNTSSPVVREYLVNAYKTFIEMGVDAFRWDTIKHMNKDDVLYFLDAFKAINPDLFVFGEVAQKRHELHNIEEINPHWYTWRGATNNSDPSGLAVLDFFAMSTFHMFGKGENMSNVMAAARYDHLYADPSTNILFLDNHDFGPNNDWNKRYGGSDENLAAALNFMWTWRGIPTLYYGTEMRFKSGAYTDIHNEQGTRESIDNTGRAYYGDVMDQASSHKIYQHIKKLNAIRKAIPALQKGRWSWAGNGGGNGVGYIREHGDSYALVGIAKDGAVSFNFSGILNGTYKDAVTGNEITTTNGSLQFNVSPSSAGVYVLNGPGRIGDLGAGFFQSSSDGGEGNGGDGGGGGSSQDPATLTFSPANPEPGDELTVTYDGFLNSQSQVNMYWGYDDWTNPTTTPMDKSGEVWRASITVPADAKTKIDLVFNNGSGTWDNNTENDYSVTVTSDDDNGGSQTNTTLTFDPTNPIIGEPLTVTYDGALNSESQVNMYWGYDGWNNPKTTPMNKSGDTWSVTIKVPSYAENKLDMVFNNGGDTWDNNNSEDYFVNLTRSGDNGGGQSADGTISWSPLNPTTEDEITIHISSTEVANLHWGVNNWQRPDDDYFPNGTFDATGAVQTPFVLQDTARVLRIGPFNGSQTVSSVNFVVYYPNLELWNNNNDSDYTINISPVTSNEFNPVVSEFKLNQNYPNPFNPTTTISFELPSHSSVRLAIYNLLGREINVLANGTFSAGVHTIQFDASQLSSGTYIYKIDTDMGSITRKMLLIK